MGKKSIASTLNSLQRRSTKAVIYNLSAMRPMCAQVWRECNSLQIVTDEKNPNTEPSSSGIQSLTQSNVTSVFSAHLRLEEQKKKKNTHTRTHTHTHTHTHTIFIHSMWEVGVVCVEARVQSK